MHMHGQPATQISLDGPKTFHLPGWGRISDATRVQFMRQEAMQAGRDPRIRTLAVQILMAAKAPVRGYEQQAQALLAWVQKRIYYVNEPGEILQSPLLTLELGYGDCDDEALLLGALCEAVALPFKFVLAGRRGQTLVRWVEGDPLPSGVVWSHIYVSVGWPPFAPSRWAWAEPTMQVPLGWDVHTAARTGRSPGMPELGSIASSAGSAVAASMDESNAQINWKQIGVAVTVGVLTSTLSTLFIDAVKAKRKRR